MEMIQAFKVNKEGEIVSSSIEPEDFQETKYIKRPWEGYFLSPKFSFVQNKWVESATDAELEAAHTNGKSVEQRLGQQISTLEIDGLEKDIEIAELRKLNKEQGQKLGQQISDLELMILGGM